MKKKQYKTTNIYIIHIYTITRVIYERIRQSLFSAVSVLTIVDSMPDGKAAITL